MSIASVKFSVEDGRQVRITWGGDEPASLVETGQALLHSGLAEWLASGHRIEPYYTFLSAEYSNPDGTAITAKTAEARSVVVTEKQSDRWAAFQKWIASGGTVGPYVDHDAEQRAKAAAESEQEKKRKALLDALLAKGVTPESIGA